MKNWIWLGVVLAVIAVSSLPGADEIKKPKGVFSSLKIGQHVTLKDEGTAFTISYFDQEMLLAHKVVEVESDHIVVRDLAGVTETTVPVYAVKGIVKVRVKGK